MAGKATGTARTRGSLPKRTERRGRRFLRGIGVAVLALAALEGALRLAVPLDALTFSSERPNGMLLHDAGSRTYLPRPGAAEERFDGPYRWHYRVNGQGFREDAEIPERRQGDELRILALGDSWIFGISATQDRTIPANLETLLPPRLGRPVEVVNAGVPGGSGYDALARWNVLKDRFEIDGVLLGQPHNYRRQDAVRGERSRWYAPEGGAPFVDAYLYLVLRRVLVPFTRADLREANKGAVDAILTDFAALAEDARGRGIPVWLGVWPGRNTVSTEAERALDDPAPWRARLGPLGVKVTGHRMGSKACYGFEDLTHPSEAGYRALAEVYADLIVTGEEPAGLRAAPRCEDVPGVGPTKPGGVQGGPGPAPGAPAGPPAG